MFYAHICFLILFGIFIGFISSIPVGSVHLKVIKKAINGHLKPALSVAIGSVTSDFIYGVLVLFGLAPFLQQKNFQIIVYSLGVVVLSFLLYRSYREHKHIPPAHAPHITYRKRTSFLTGFTIAITNPGMIVWWIVGYRLLLDLQLFDHMTATLRGIFLVSCCAGLGGYLSFIALLLNKVQESLSDKLLDRMNIIIMVLLVFVILYFSLKLVSIVCNVHIAYISSL